MTTTRRAFCLLASAAALSACGARGRPKAHPPATSGLHAGASPAMRRLVDHYASVYDVPAALVHRVIQRESGYRPEARNGPYYGLMQILPQTARTMGHRGEASELLDAETNLKYGVKYLRGAWLLSHGSYDEAIGWYARGYYYEAKRRGMLVETGLRPA